MESKTYLDKNLEIAKIGIFKNKVNNEIKFLYKANNDFGDIKNGMKKVNEQDFSFMNNLKVKEIDKKPVFVGLISKNKFICKMIAENVCYSGKIKVKDVIVLEELENKLYKKILNKKFKDLKESEIDILLKWLNLSWFVEWIIKNTLSKKCLMCFFVFIDFNINKDF